MSKFRSGTERGGGTESGKRTRMDAGLSPRKAIEVTQSLFRVQEVRLKGPRFLTEQLIVLLEERDFRGD